jgi:REP element-mobilizing transposase RayT
LLEPQTTWFVTTRCVDARFLLRPDPGLNAAVGMCLAKACRRHPGIVLLGVVVMSNHLHLLVVDEKSELSSFMELFLGTLAKAVNNLRKRRGHVFERRFSAEPVLDPWALVDRWMYLVQNPVQAGLVARHDQWPGLLLVATGREPRRQVFRRFLADKYEAARMVTPVGADPPSPMEFYEEEVVQIAPLPDEVMRVAAPPGGRTLLEEIRRWEGFIAQQRRDQGLGFLGVERVLAQDPLGEPARPKRSPRPLCHTAMLVLYNEYRDMIRALRRAYAEMSAAYRRGAFDVEFPRYTFRPCVPLLSTA